MFVYALPSLRRSLNLHFFTFLFLTCFSLILTTTPALAKDKFSIAWSIYVGWMPWDYGANEGIVKKWASKYGIEIDVVQINDYIESINQYTAGKFDGCTMTNMDGLTIPAAGGVDSTAIIVGDFSNGNDGVVLKNGNSMADIKGRKVNLVELSVSHYLLARGLESVGMAEKDVKVINTSDADIVATYSSPGVNAVTTWNPQLSEIKKMPNSTVVFDSSKIPGEIIDLLVVNTKTLKENPKFGKALAGAWYEIMDRMSQNTETGRAALSYMAKASGTNLAGYQSQLYTTKMFYQAFEATTFVRSEQLIETMRNVAKFSFQHGLLGEGASSPDFIGIEFPGQKTIGNKGNIKLRFDDTYMAMAAAGKL